MAKIQTCFNLCLKLRMAMVQTTLLATVTIMQEKYAPEKIILIEHTYSQNIPNFYSY